MNMSTAVKQSPVKTVSTAMNMLSYRQADSNVKCYQSVSEAMAMCPIFAFLILGSYPLTCPGCVELYLCKEFSNCKMG